VCTNYFNSPYDRETDGWTDRGIDRLMDGEMDRQIDGWTDRGIERLMDGEKGIGIDRLRGV